MDILDIIIILVTFITFVVYRYAYNENKRFILDYLLPLISITSFILIFNNELYMYPKAMIITILLIASIFMLLDYCSFLFLKCIRYFKERGDD